MFTKTPFQIEAVQYFFDASSFRVTKLGLTYIQFAAEGFVSKCEGLEYSYCQYVFTVSAVEAYETGATVARDIVEERTRNAAIDELLKHAVVRKDLTGSRNEFLVTSTTVLKLAPYRVWSNSSVSNEKIWSQLELLRNGKENVEKHCLLPGFVGPYRYSKKVI